MKCDDCKHNRSTYDSITVEGITVADYEDWMCAKEDDLTEEQIDIVMNNGNCPFYECDMNLHNPCYECPDYDVEYCKKCYNRNIGRPDYDRTSQ